MNHPDASTSPGFVEADAATVEGILRVTTGVVSIFAGSWAPAGARSQPAAASAAAANVRRVQVMGTTARARLRSKMG